MIEDKICGIDLNVFIDIKDKYNLRDSKLVIYSYLRNIDMLYRTIPHQNPLWYQEEALRRTDNHYKLLNDLKKV